MSQPSKRPGRTDRLTPSPPRSYEPSSSTRWAEALATYETAAELVTSAHWRGVFLDGAALAAQELGRKDAVRKLEVAWLGAPSLPRLMRWVLASERSARALRRRAAEALVAGPTRAPRIVGFLQVLVGEIEPAAKLLANAPGLGWSGSDHPGHLLFLTFAWLLCGASAGAVVESLLEPVSWQFEYGPDFEEDHRAARPRLPSVTVADALGRAKVGLGLTSQSRAAMLAAMKAAATHRTAAVLEAKSRQHYGHAASLIACCVELERGRGSAGAPSAWAEALRARASRFPAFQKELRHALTPEKMLLIDPASH